MNYQTIKKSWNDETETHAMHIRSLEYKTYCVIETQCDDDTKLRHNFGSQVSGVALRFALSSFLLFTNTKIAFISSYNV